MPQYFKSLPFKIGMIHLVLFSVREFNETMAAHTLGVMVGFLIIDMLKMMMFVPKGGFADNTGFQQITQHPIDSGP